MHTGAFSQWQANAYLLIFYSLNPERATKQRLSLLQLKSWGLGLSVRCSKHSLRHSKYRGIAHGSNLPMAKKYLFANLLLFESGEWDKTTLPSIATQNAMIDSSKSLLEEPIATFYMRGGVCEREHFHNGNQMPICQSFILYSRIGQQSNVSFFYSLKHGD